MNFKCGGILGIVLCFSVVYAIQAQSRHGSAQGQSDALPYISWVGQYPAVKEGTEKKSGARRVYEFLIRKNEQRSLVRPVGVLATGPNDLFILDQGSRSGFDIQDKKCDIPRCFRKKENYFTSLVGICSMPNGEMLFTDSRLNKVYRISADKKKLTELNDSLKLDQPTGIAYSPVTHEIWVVETNAHRISILNDNGVLIKTIGSRGDENLQFNFPTSIWIDKTGDVYVVDAMNFRIKIFNKNGEFLSEFGEAGDTPGSFARPKGIATDTYGNIYVVDGLSNVVQIFDRQGRFLYTFGKQGRAKEEFWMPSGIFIDNRNYIYIADNYNSRVQIFQLVNGS